MLPEITSNPSELDKAVWRGGPNQDMLRLIQALTYVDGLGRVHYRLGFKAPWHRLLTKHDYQTLNDVLDSYRGFIAEIANSAV